MPQFDTSNFSSQIFWLVICFFTMLLMMSKIIVPMLQSIMQERSRKIDGNLDQAAKIQEQAEASYAKYQKALEDASNKANASIVETKKELKDFIDAKEQEITSRLNNKIAEGEKQISQTKEAALNNAKAASASLAFEIVKKINIAGITEQDLKSALNSIKEN